MTPSADAFTPTAADFLPLDGAHRGAVAPPAAARPDAWQRLRRDRTAMCALTIIGALFLAALLGPVAWRVDPARQFLAQVSEPPSFGTAARVVDDTTPPAAAPAPAPAPDAATRGLRVIGEPNTVVVRLAWTPVTGARGYAIHRHELDPAGGHDLGLPLGQTDADTTRWDDRLALEPRRYVYAVAPLDASGDAGDFASVALTPSRAIRLAEVRALDPARPIAAGATLRLPAHPLGTDYLGRDLLARLLHGARVSLSIGIGAPLLCVLLGIAVGGIAGYAGGHLDNLLMRGADFVVALPFLLFMILFKVGFGIGPGESGVLPMTLALVVLGWPGPARLVRAEVARLRDSAHVQAARLMGAGATYLLRVHLLPNAVGVVLVALSFAIPHAIFTEAFLSFLGLGVVPPNPSWGSMCSDGLRNILSHPHELAVPAACISVTVLAFNVLGDALRDAFDVRAGDRP